MNFREAALKTKRVVTRYFSTYFYVLKPYNSAIREDVLTSRFNKGVSPLWFFGITTTVATLAVDKLARYQIVSIDLKPTWWQAPFDIEILNVNLKNTCVDFINALMMAMIAYAIARAFRQVVTLRKCLSAFLYAYAIFILFSAIVHLYSLNFGTLAEPVGVSRTQFEFSGDRKLWLQTGAESFGFDGDRLRFPLPPFLHSLMNSASMYFVPAIYPLFHSSGLSFTFHSNWHEAVIFLFVIDIKVLLAAYILRLRLFVSALIVVLCSIIGFYLDAVVSRFTAKHGVMLYASTRMMPSVVPQQAVKYSTTYFDNFPIKTADLAIIDYSDCQRARYNANHNFIDGTAYMSGPALSFETTYTDCTKEPWSPLRFLLPQYEIVRIVAVAGQTVEINRRGEIKVDGSLIAQASSKTEEEFQYTRNKAIVDGTLKPGDTPTPAQLRETVNVPVKGERYEYEYFGTNLPHEPGTAAYIWECTECGDESVVEGDKVTIPPGSVFGMFDNQTRPRFILFNGTDILGHPFVKAEKRW
jgi:hypothetical protein